MNTNNVGIILGTNEHSLCQKIFKVLRCNALWIMKSNGSSLSVLLSDQAFWDHYWDRKYYLDDPNIKRISLKEAMGSKAGLGSDQQSFQESGFLYDLYKLFDVEEFISIEQQVGEWRYCFRFFSRHNRFFFINQVLKTLPVIEYFMDHMIEKCKSAFDQQPGFTLAEPKPQRGG